MARGILANGLQDEFGLPAFHYTCDQIADPLAVQPGDSRHPVGYDHVHQVGNDRIIAIVFQLRPRTRSPG